MGYIKLQSKSSIANFNLIWGSYLRTVLSLLVCLLGSVVPGMASSEVVFQTNEKVHVGDEEISSWSPLYGSCVTITLPDVEQGDQVAFYYRPYGVENAQVSFMGMTRLMPAQRPQPGKKRPNYWGEMTRMDFTAPSAGSKPLIEVCAENVSETRQKVDFDDFMMTELVVERIASAHRTAPTTVAPTPTAPPPNAPGETLQIITQTNWTLISSQSCGIGDKETDYQRFLTTEYYNVTGGREFHANDGEVNYFTVDEASRRFGAKYSTYTNLTNAPWNISTYTGQLHDDGSLHIVHEFQQIDTGTMNAPRPNYSLERKEYVLWPCDRLPKKTVAAPGAERVLISVAGAESSQDNLSCDALFAASFERSTSELITTLQKVNGVWQGKNNHSAKCEVTMPNLCPLFNKPWINTPRELAADPLVLRVDDGTCQSDYQFGFNGAMARVDVTYNTGCSREPYSFYMMECRP